MQQRYIQPSERIFCFDYKASTGIRRFRPLSSSPLRVRPLIEWYPDELIRKLMSKFFSLNFINKAKRVQVADTGYLITFRREKALPKHIEIFEENDPVFEDIPIGKGSVKLSSLIKVSPEVKS